VFNYPVDDTDSIVAPSHCQQGRSHHGQSTEGPMAQMGVALVVTLLNISGTSSSPLDPLPILTTQPSLLYMASRATSNFAAIHRHQCGLGSRREGHFLFLDGGLNAYFLYLVKTQLISGRVNKISRFVQLQCRDSRTFAWYGCE
jgi:hypothetical protein